MEKLAFLATFVSLIYGLAVANVLAHVASLVKRGRAADWYWIHTLWSVHLLVLLAGDWWTLQNWAGVPRIGFLVYLSLLLKPSLLFIASDLLFPERGGGDVDLKAHFFAVKRAFFLALIAFVAADQIDSLLKGWGHVVELGPYHWVGQAIWLAMFAGGIATRSERLLGASVMISLLLYIAGMINALAAV